MDNPPKSIGEALERPPKTRLECTEKNDTVGGFASRQR
jgi:hypothetical protein